jgi:predicted dienelactone hydrolase
MRAVASFLFAVLSLYVTCANAVGFEPIRVELDRGRHATGGVWYPSPAPVSPTTIGAFPVNVALRGEVAAGRLPLVVVSHGTGGTFAGHVDTAMALADAGYVVAAMSHPADNAGDHSGLGTPAQLVDRVHDLSRLIDHVTSVWRGSDRIDRERIGAFGFSAGGYTVLTAMGARPDFARLPGHCREHAHDPVCEPLMKRWHTMLDAAAPAPEPRIRAVVAAAPGLGLLLDLGPLRSRAADIQLWRAGNDEVLLHPFHVEVVAKALGAAADYRVVGDAGHYAFLAPCPGHLADVLPAICRDAAAFDRAAFHHRFNGEIVDFFARRLGR